MIKETLRLLIAGIFMVIIVTSVLHFTSVDTTPKHYDYANHIHATLQIVSAVKNHDWGYLFRFYNRYPPFMYWLLACYYLILGYSQQTTAIFNISLLFFLIIVVYLYTRTFADSFAAEMSGIFTAGLVLQITRQYSFYLPLYHFMMDYPLLVMTAVSYCTILYGIRKKSFTVLQGVIAGSTFGFALLTKWTSLTLLLLPYLWYCYLCWKHKKTATIITIIISVMLTGGWWYILHIRPLLFNFIHWTNLYQQYNSSSDYVPYLSRFYFFSYVWILFSLPILDDVIQKLLHRKGRHAITSLPTNIFSLESINVGLSFLIFFFIPIHDFRFLYPTLFVNCMIVFWAILRNGSRLKMKWLYIGVILYTAFAVWESQPEVSTKKYSIHYVRTFIQTLNPSSVGILFANDVPTFNRDNVSLFFYELVTMYHAPLKYVLLNNYGNQDGCDAQFAPDVLIIYTSSVKAAPEDKYYYFVKKCPEVFRNKYVFSHQQTAVDGTVTYFTKNNLR